MQLAAESWPLVTAGLSLTDNYSFWLHENDDPARRYISHNHGHGPATPPSVNHDFDFWVGEWEVANQANGKKAGENRIERQHGGRVLVENYTTPGKYTGMSLNAYDGLAKRWHQCWMDNTGGVLDLYGGLVGGSMVMTGETTTPQGTKQLERITWTPNADGSVRQHWEQSADGGEKWTTAFDGLYRKKK